MPKLLRRYELKRRGAQVIVEPKTIRPGVRIAFIQGPDDVRIELLERTMLEAAAVLGAPRSRLLAAPRRERAIGQAPLHTARTPHVRAAPHHGGSSTPWATAPPRG